MRSKEHQAKIDQINEWVQAHKDGDTEAAGLLILQFKPFLTKQSKRWNDIYKGVHPWEAIMQEASTIFWDLLNEYTIGGNAYFNVYIERKLPLRLRYFFIKEIKRRTRDLSYSDEQFSTERLIGSGDNIEELIDHLDEDDRLDEIVGVIKDNDILTDRERDMVIRHIVKDESHTSIAKSYDLSRSRVSRIISNAVAKIQGNVRYR